MLFKSAQKAKNTIIEMPFKNRVVIWNFELFVYLQNGYKKVNGQQPNLTDT